MRTLLLALIFAAAAAPGLASASVSLRSSPVSDADAVTIADVFDGVSGPAGRVVLAPAPKPGLHAVLDAGRVQMVARNAGVDWRNPTGLRHILVSAPGAPREAAVAATGRAQVLTYTRNVMTGEIIQAADLAWSDQAVAGPDTLGDPERLIGQAARHALRSGAAVRAGDLSPAAVVHRDETIDVAFEAPGVSIVLQGKALKDAAVGEPVQVLNPQSKKVIEAVASAPGRAVVGARADALKAVPFTTASLR